MKESHLTTQYHIVNKEMEIAPTII